MAGALISVPVAAADEPAGAVPATVAAPATAAPAASARLAGDYVDAILSDGTHVPCGVGPVRSGAVPPNVIYTVGNCHTYSVGRRIEFTT